MNLYVESSPRLVENAAVGGAIVDVDDSRILYSAGGSLFVPPLHAPDRALFVFGVVNVVLAAFNLIPIPPLDGSAVLERLLPTSALPSYFRLRQYSMLILFGVVFLLPGFLSRIFGPAIHLWGRLLT